MKNYYINMETSCLRNIDKGDETFNYMVYSYDERGRVEAQVRYTENIGFDAIHYFYNSQNTITKKVVIDPYKTLATWYGYDKYGRIDSVWNELYPMNYFSIPNQINSVFTGERPPSSFYDVLYHYDKMDRIDTISYRTGFDTKKQINHYSPRSELTGMSVPNQYSNTYSYSGSGLLQQKTTIYPVYDSLLYDFTSTVNYIHNSYDFTNRLIGYNATLNGKHSFGNYYYDAAGNRDSSRSIATLNPLHPDYKCNRIHQNTYSDTYRNRLIEEVQYDNNNVPVKYQFFDYLGNGNLHQRRIKEIHSDSLAGTFIGWDHQVEKFGYNYNNLTINYQKQFKLNVLPKDSIFLNSYNFEEWRYRYNPFGERESKMRWSKCVDSNFSMSPVNAWVYYSLGISNEQNVVYQGFETSESMIYGRTPFEMYQNYSQAPVLFMYPVEYNVFANGRNPVMTYKYDPLAAGWRKFYNIYDELGSVAMVINDSGEVVESNQYKAFGVKDYAFKERPQATGYIGKEKDTESNLGDHGVRKYDSDLGRFLCPDAMWEKYLAYTPYQYAGNDPVNKIDWNGKYWDIILDVGFIGYDLYDIGKSLVKGQSVTSTQFGALGADVACAATPFLTGGGLAVRATAKADDAANAVKKVSSITEFFKKSDFGKEIIKLSEKTNFNYKGSKIYTVTEKSNNSILKKGDYFYLDSKHKDHIEVFDRNGNVKNVLNLDGTINNAKTEKVLKEKRTIQVN